MKILKKIVDNWGKVLLAVVIMLAVAGVSIMVVNLYKISAEQDILADSISLKYTPDPFPYARYQALLAGFSEIYKPPVIHKRNIFSQRQDSSMNIQTGRSQKAGEFKSPVERFCVLKVYKKPVKLLFKGYLQLPDGSYVATINWGGKTDFKKIGEQIRGYQIMNFEKDIGQKETVWGGVEKIDKSVISLTREGGEKIVLQIGRITLGKEIYAEVKDRKDMRSYDVYVGSVFLGNNVLDILPEKTIIETQNGDRVDLQKCAQR